MSKQVAQRFLKRTVWNYRKTSVPKFHGNILHWSSFWDQFKSVINDREKLPHGQKLVHLRDAVKDGPARMVIERLSQSSETYSEAIECWGRYGKKWRDELPVLRNHRIPCCHYSKDAGTEYSELHGFCEASELAYAGVIF